MTQHEILLDLDLVSPKLVGTNDGQMPWDGKSKWIQTTG